MEITLKRSTLYLAILSLAFLGCAKEIKETDYEKLSVDDYGRLDVKRSLLKDYAVCSCIYFGNNKDSIFKKDNSFSVLAEISQFEPKVYNEVDKFVENYAKQIPEGFGDNAGTRPVLFRCVGLYKTEKLDSLINKLTQ